MRAAMTIAIIFVVVLIGILGFAATKPNTLNIQRVADIKAPPERIFALINDFHNWQAWAPQDKMDSTMKRTFGGIVSGKGASSEWVSKGNAGSGRMEIIESTPPFKVTVRVDFVKPFEAHNINEFTLEPMDDMTRVTWAMHGTKPYIAKVMSIFLNMDRMLGKHFEAGLYSLKTLSEQ
ncbi:MAG TPA: SRPBCC family protein [Chthoniobacterales bacterium]|jgi:uncharacterized protein YndB with AHSA1/START domain|nr:SRPBCC family protein [Chthoniobacterales bacterium]